MLPSEVQIVVVTDGGWGDLATNIGRVMRKRDVVVYAKELGYLVVELDEANANEKAFDAAMAVTEPTKFACGTGHGNETVYTGYQQQSLLSPGTYGRTRGKFCSWVSCEFGKSIDQRLSDSFGCLGEVSYRDTVWFNVNDSQHPETDPSCNRFFKCFHAWDRFFLGDETFDDAALKQIATYRDEISKAPPLDRYYLEADLACIQHKTYKDMYGKSKLREGVQPPTKYQPSKWTGSFVVSKEAEERKASKIEGQFTKPKYAPGEVVVWNGKLCDAETGVGLADRIIAAKEAEATTTAKTDMNGAVQFAFVKTEEGVYDVFIAFAGDA